MMRKMLLGVGFLIWTQVAIASRPYVEYEYQYTQPNGDVVTIIANGDDYFAEQHAVTGELVIYDETVGGMVYATVNEERTQLISTGELVQPADFETLGNRYIRRRGLSTDTKEEESTESQEQKLGSETEQQSVSLLTPMQQAKQRASLASGNVRGLTIIIQFPDEPATLSRSQVDNYLNDLNYNEFGNDTSIRGYFQSVSGGQLDYTNTVTRYYTAEHKKSYYTDDDYQSHIKSRELITEALSWLENTEGFDFSTLTTDANGYIMGLNILYSGATDSAWSRGLWPHMGRLQPTFCADNVCTDRYQISNMGNELKIGVFAHETGHLLARWPDLYDYDGSSFGSAGAFDLMGLGSVGTDTIKNPVPPNGFFRYLAGWDTVIELNPELNADAPQGELSHTSESHSLYRWTNPARQEEAFYIENIHQSGQNELQPDSGLAIWHIDPDGDNNNEWLPYVQLEHADGSRDPENKVNSGDATDLFDTGSFELTVPNSEEIGGTNSTWSTGADSGLAIKDINALGVTAYFNVGEEDPRTESFHYGYLYHREIQIQPNGSWFYYEGGTIDLELLGPGYSDFDMRLERWNGYGWELVGISQSYSSEESISYEASAGYYRVRVYSYYGSGYYQLKITK
ncbi:M6 family metalloprotease domain-containing protein [Kangiella sediminilitoris]|uniref:Peptidase n=1 Tax=Kangiella sediminilitoris TaxID=1144748 RepID=A0A1B3BBH2_9GAMM|nr:M6 family metalloprotease domain-containing protein [Kangiella sediminilitoris]AOE50141.1 peptidase [Kangiella sediminilitoris]